MTALQQGAGEAAMIQQQVAAKAYLIFLQANKTARLATATAAANGIALADPFGDSVPATIDDDAKELAKRLAAAGLVDAIEAERPFGPPIVIPNQQPLTEGKVFSA